MATALRPALLRQALAAPSKRAFSSAATSSMAFRSRLSLSPRPVSALQRAAFQTSVSRQILPPLPQKIDGTVNDAAPVHDPHPMHGSYHWTMERVVSAGLVPLTLIPFAAGSVSPLLDGALIGMLTIHSYIGFQSCITDYFPTWRVAKTRVLLDWVNFLWIFIAGWGFYEFETNDVGLVEAIKRIWKA